MAVVEYQAPQSISDAISILKKTDIKNKVMGGGDGSDNPDQSPKH